MTIKKSKLKTSKKLPVALPEKVKKTRLLVRDREELSRFASRIAQANALLPEKNAAVGAFHRAIHQRAEQWLTPQDRKTLARFDFLSTQTSIVIQDPGGYDLKVHLTIEWVAKAWPAVRLPIPQSDVEFWDLEKAFRHATKAWDEERQRVERDYDTLIHSSKTWEDLLEIWPEAAKFAPSSTPSTALVALNSEVIARIQADVARRAQAAEVSA